MTAGRDPYRTYRRQMRRSLRRGGYPVIIGGQWEPLGLIAAAALGRWLYRHRSAFWPFAITAALFTAAAVIHRHHPGAWPLVLAVTLLTGVFLGMPHQVVWAQPALRASAGALARAWEACGISRTAERAYATVITTAAGLWLTAAAGIGPAAKPLPAIALLATVILGIPWWAHRRRRARVRATRAIQAWPQLADNMGLPGSAITSIIADQWGWTGRVRLRKGTTAAHAIAQAPAIESGLGIRAGTARVLPDPARADHVMVRVIETDPHARPITWHEPEHRTITQPIPLGLFEDGSPVLARIAGLHMLIAGTTGAGKSGIVNLIAAALAQCTDVTRLGIDMKGGMELQPWAPALHDLATTPRQATTLLARAVSELDRRAALLASLGIRTWHPAPHDPAIVILIDEFAELPPEAIDHADSIARRGRAVAIILIAATQRPTQDAMGHNAVRSQMDTRICLRVRERRDTDLILGQGALAAGWDAHALTLPGSFLISSPAHTTPVRARAALITDEQVTAHARRHAIAAPSRSTDTASARNDPQTAPAEPSYADPDGKPADPDTALWEALRDAGPDGVTPAALALVTGRGRSWVHERLREHAAAGRITQVRYGRWRALPPPATPGHAR